jgi:hypothetical protein
MNMCYQFLGSTHEAVQSTSQTKKAVGLITGSISTAGLNHIWVPFNFTTAGPKEGPKLRKSLLGPTQVPHLRH